MVKSGPHSQFQASQSHTRGPCPKQQQQKTNNKLLLLNAFSCIHLTLKPWEYFIQIENETELGVVSHAYNSST